MRKLLLSISLIVSITELKAQLFSQNFSSSTVVSNYVSGTPTVNQFTSISNAVNNPSSITANSLRFTKTGGSTGYFARSIAFSGPPQMIQIKFDFEISANPNILNTNQATFYIGSTIADNATAPANADFHSRLTFNFDATIGNFSLRDVGASTNGANSYSGRRTITFVVNNSGFSQTYTAPDGSNESIANDTYDIWVGLNKEFNDRNSTTAASTLSSFRFQYPSGSVNATLDFDNFVISELSTLPITLTSFTGKETNKSILLNWVTASEKNNKTFELFRSVDGKIFKSIGTVAGAGDSDAELKYAFVDANPFGGTNYYQLKQIDFDGKNSTSETIAIDSKISDTQITVYAASSSINIGITSPNETAGKITLSDISGRKITEQNINLNKGYNTLELNAALTPGVHFITLENEGRLYRQKFIK